MGLLDKADPEKMSKALQAMAEGMAQTGYRPGRLSGFVSYTQADLDAAIAAERERIYLETYTVLACARFVILCQRDGISVDPEKVQDAVERIDLLIRNQEKKE